MGGGGFKPLIHYTNHKQSQALAKPQASTCNVWECSSSAMSLWGSCWTADLICHFQIFWLACGSGRVVCGGKIAHAKPAVSFVYLCIFTNFVQSVSKNVDRVSCLLWYFELHQPKWVISTLFHECTKSLYWVFVQCNYCTVQYIWCLKISFNIAEVT